MRIYLSGPMTGIKDFNYPAFNEAAHKLRTLGFVVENPAENTPPACGTWQGWMRAAIKQMSACDMVATLDGWLASKGAMVEVRLAFDLGIKVVMIEEFLEQATKQVE